MIKLEQIFHDPWCYILQCKRNRTYTYAQDNSLSRWQYGGYVTIVELVQAINDYDLIRYDLIRYDFDDILLDSHNVIKKFRKSKGLETLKDLVPELFL